ncbi:hypothetical protein KDU71_07445 [Carboxylicivirga sediminis]|uniref:Uncharacterized protein n=1 Tax=Carboxylicivirga sediminis TaxID=2006564 RepID=A0A941F489_9BACT|nr:hypothetical protein [Carboxylicivirga sediminis]MBR8535390.1 hypothetical protein [Carboxylicivirga sediminis]
MLQPLYSNNDVSRFIDKFQKETKQRFYDIFVQAGEHGVRIARTEGRYIDHTGNLRSSIGYAVADSGSIKVENFQKAGVGTDQEKGLSEAKRLANEVAKQHHFGLVLIIVAGMDYAVYVENMENKDVLTNAVFSTQTYLKELMVKILKY